jgi:cytochrome oxidase assembly protein ShyY1
MSPPIRFRSNTAAAVLLWAAVIALATLAWAQVRIAHALEDIAARCTVSVSASPTSTPPAH